MIRLDSETYLHLNFQQTELLGYVRPCYVFSFKADECPITPAPCMQIVAYMRQQHSGGGGGAPFLLRAWYLDSRVPQDGYKACSDPLICDPKTIKPGVFQTSRPQMWMGEFADAVHRYAETPASIWMAARGDGSRHALFHGYEVAPFRPPLTVPIISYNVW